MHCKIAHRKRQSLLDARAACFASPLHGAIVTFCPGPGHRGAQKDTLPHCWRATRGVLSAMAAGMQQTSALDEAIALIDSLCAKLRTEADDGAASSHAEGAGGTALQSAPPVRKPWQSLASSRMPDGQPSTAAPSAVAGAAEPTNGQSASAAGPAAAGGRQKKEKKEKKQAALAAEETTADLFGRALLQVARVISVEALPTSDKLYKTRVQVAGGEERQIIAGLRKHIEQQQLQGSLVIVILNLKTAKLAGEPSEGMILAAVHKDESLPAGELVHPIRPNGGAEVGSRVYIEGTSPSEAPPKVLKSGPWGQIKELLQLRGGAATFDGRSLVTAAGPVTVTEEMPDGAAIS